MVCCPLSWQTGYDSSQHPMDRWDDRDVQQLHDAMTLKDMVHDGAMMMTRHQQCHPTLPVSQDQKSWCHNADLSRYMPSATTTSGLVLSLSGKSTSTRNAWISSSTCSPSCASSVEWCGTSRWAFTPSPLPSLPPPVPSLGEVAHFYIPFLSYFLDFPNTWPTLPTHLNSSSLSFPTHSFST